MEIKGEEIPYADASEEELDKLKLWLFRENIRIQAEKDELAENKKAFEREMREKRQSIKEEMRVLEYKRRQCENQEHLIDEKWKILKRGFDELNEDRQSLKRLERQMEDMQRRKAKQQNYLDDMEGVNVFFKGVTDTLSLKKRYRDLLKIFHPDNIAGDKDTVLSINREYDNLKNQLD